MTWTIHTGDCRTILPTIPDASIDSVVCDPPYELGFMGKRWDAAGIAYDVTVWAEVLRVLKPGGYLLAFGGTRTYHRMTVAIEDAGFEIRDSIHWVYGSGFPKSHNVAKAIDKAAGAPVKVGKAFRVAGEYGGRNLDDPHAQGAERDAMRHAAITPEAAQWEGWGTALKPAHEPIVVARKPLNGTVAANVLEHGTGALNIDGCRVGTEEVTTHSRGATTAYAKRPGQKSVEEYGATTPQNRPEFIGNARTGRWPANFVLTHAADCRPAGEAVWDCHPDCPAAVMDEQTDGASRYFTQTAWDNELDGPPFLYQPKANKRERNTGLDTPNPHPTVKPVALMEWLTQLVTPPDGTVLDPFTGSGTTGIAATKQGYRFIGIEQDADYAAIAEARIRHHDQPPPTQPPTPTLF